MATEGKLRDLKNEAGVVTIESQQRVLGERLGRLAEDLLQAETAAKATEAELGVLRRS